MNLETQIGRLEQQLDAFETLHREELKKFEEKLATYSRLQARAGRARELRDRS